MADNKVPDIAVVRRTYNGLEGHRVKAGTRFAVGREQGGLKVITKARFQTLAQSGILRAFGDEDTKGPATVRPSPPLARTVTTMEGPGGPSARKIRDAVRKRTRQASEPGAPKQVKGPVNAQASTSPGSQTGEGSASSVSLGDQAQNPSTPKRSGRRGTRGAAPAEAVIPPASPSSPSTTR